MKYTYSVLTCFVIVSLSILSAATYAQSNELRIQDDLLSVLEAAANNDHERSSNIARLQGQQQAAKQQQAALLPTVQLTASQSEIESETNNINSDYDANNNAITIRQPLLRPDRFFTFKAGRADYQAAKAGLLATEQTFIINTSNAYFDVLRAQAFHEFAQAEFKALTRQLEQAQERYDVGLISMTDVHEARAAHDQSQVTLIQSENQLAIAQDSLAMRTGQSSGTLKTLSTEYPIAAVSPNNIHDWEQLALSNNYELAQSSSNELAARERSREATSDLLPDIDLVATQSNSERPSAPGSAVAETESTEISLQLSWTLFQGGAVNARRKQQKFNHIAAQEQHKLTRQQVLNQTRNLFRTVSSDVATVKARTQAVASAQSASEATQLGYDVGTRSLVDVLVQQRAMFAAQRDLANARYDYAINHLQLEAIAGQLDRQDIENLNQWMK